MKLKHDSLALFLTENCPTGASKQRWLSSVNLPPSARASAHHAAALLIHRVSEWSRNAALLLLSVRLWSFRDSRGKYRSRGPDSCKRTQHKHTRLWIINRQNWSKAYYRSNDNSFTQELALRVYVCTCDCVIMSCYQSDFEKCGFFHHDDVDIYLTRSKTLLLLTTIAVAICLIPTCCSWSSYVLLDSSSLLDSQTVVCPEGNGGGNSESEHIFSPENGP